MDAKELKEYAELAQAAYADFFQNTSQAALLNSRNGAFSEYQVTLFLENYEIVHQYTDFGINGFSATVFRDKNNPERLILSCRGTEFSGDRLRDLLVTDLQIGIFGYAAPQAVPLYRYIKRLQTVANESVSYTNEEIANLYFLKSGEVIPQLELESRMDYLFFKNNLLSDVGISTSQYAGAAVLDGSREVDLAGHSLGGHLALLAQRLFPGTFDDVVTTNAVTFYAPPMSLNPTSVAKAESILSRFGEWDESKIIRIESVGDGVSELGRHYPGLTMTVGMETRYDLLDPFGANHSVANVADGLALTELIGRLDSRFMDDPRLIKPFLDVAASTPGLEYENILDALRRMITTGAITATRSDNLDLRGDGRRDFYLNLNNLSTNETYQGLIGNVQFQQVNVDEMDVRHNFSHFLSLYYLTPFHISTLNENAETLLKSAN